MRRREFIAGLGSAAAWPVVARAQQAAMPVIGFVSAGSADAPAGSVAEFRKELGETGYVEGRNVTIEYHWLEGQFDRLPSLMTTLMREDCPNPIDSDPPVRRVRRPVEPASNKEKLDSIAPG